MGTNYYARIIPTESQIQNLKELIDKKYYKTLCDNVDKLFGFSDAYEVKGLVHLGKRSSGWKFLWNCNIRSEWDVTKSCYIYKPLYPLTKEGIREFLSAPNIKIISEYYIDGDESECFTVDEFLNMAFNWCSEGVDLRTYNEGKTYLYNQKGDMLASACGYSSFKGLEFYSDGLRFSTSLEFS